ncbi:MAG: S8 family serine peptidase [Oceanococcus sp.]
MLKKKPGLGLLLLCVSLLTACQGGRLGTNDGRALEAPDLLPAIPQVQLPAVDPALLTRLQSADANEDIQVIVGFHGRSAATKEQLLQVASHGVTRALPLRHLPIAGVLAKPAQVRSMMADSSLRSLWHNAQLEYDDERANYLTSVDQTIAAPELTDATGQPITGEGVTIFVNDSGVDGTHPDLSYGDKVLANALAHTNLRMYALTIADVIDGFPAEAFPTTWTEGVPNTDFLGSHGTHVAGIAAGDGSASDGKYTGAARGANIVGYGSGATLLVLDALGGFDFAAEIAKNRPEYNLRIVTNSFGDPSQQGMAFEPSDPTNIATKILTDLGLIVVFSAGNSGNGPDSITGNYKKAPWILIAGNGTMDGYLADSSSRGALGNGSYELEIDGEIFLVEDRPTVITPGTDYISARAIALDPFTPLDFEADFSNGDIEPQYLPFYTQKTGTSMAAPHLAGLVAMLLQAKPDLTWREVKSIFKTTATNMPGYAPWEVGAGFANIEAAVAMAQGLNDYGSVNHLNREFNAVVATATPREESFTLDFLPVGPTDTVEFEVADDIALVIASWVMPDTGTCTCAVVLMDPAGNRYGSGIALPVLAPKVSASAPGMTGTWTLTVSGIGAVSGVAVDPLGVTNGVALPGLGMDIKVQQFPSGEVTGLDDVLGVHPAESLIQAAVARRLMDSRSNGLFEPDAPLLVGELIEYLMSWGVRQTRDHGQAAPAAGEQGRRLAAALEAVQRKGALILDSSDESRALIESSLDVSAPASRQLVAYTLVQAMGLQSVVEQEENYDLVYVDEEGFYLILDSFDVDPEKLGHLQEAIFLGILDVTVAGELAAYVYPKESMTRAEFAAMAMRAYGSIVFPE